MDWKIHNKNKFKARKIRRRVLKSKIPEDNKKITYLDEKSKYSNDLHLGTRTRHV